MAQYTIQLIKNTSIIDTATQEQKIIVCKYMALFLQCASDNLSVSGSIPLWESADLDLESQIVDFIAEAQSILGGWLHNRDLLTSESICAVQKQLIDDSYGLMASSYYSGRTYSALTAEIVESGGYSAHTNDATLIRGFRRSNDAFVAAAYLTSCSESEEVFRLCNHLLTDLTEHDFGNNIEEGMLTIVRAPALGLQ